MNELGLLKYIRNWGSGLWVNELGLQLSGFVNEGLFGIEGLGFRGLGLRVKSFEV